MAGAVFGDIGVAPGAPSIGINDESLFNWQAQYLVKFR